ncbi:MAG: hypothetical protein AMXMBFR84_18080 [Candidatus Hydrogenedentota bacterium]
MRASIWAYVAFSIVSVTCFAEVKHPVNRIQFEGPMRDRVEAVVSEWALPAPEANPGMLEMFRLRDRQPDYEDPVPWAGEFAGKYLQSCVLLRRMSANPELEGHTRRFVHDLIATQADDGYLGPFRKEERLLGHWDLWGHYHVMLGLYMWYAETGDRAALDCATRAADLVCATYLDGDKTVHDAGSHEMNMAIIHVMGLLYRETENPRYLKLMRQVELDWEKAPAGDYLRTALDGKEFFETPKPRWESLHPMQGLTEFYRITGDEKYKQALMHHWHSIHRWDIHNAGSFSTNEGAVGNPFKPGSIETCCTVAWIAYSIDALALSRDSLVADAIERSTWNAVLGYLHPSGRWCTYDTPMDGKRLASAHSIVFQSRPGTPELNCCSVNGPRGLGLIAEWAVTDDEGGIYVNYYGPCRIDATLTNGEHWGIEESTAYPNEGEIRIAFTPSGTIERTIHFRIPSWSRRTSIRVDNEAPADAIPGTYHAIRRTWQPGDTVTLDVDLSVWSIRGDSYVDHKSSVFRGPILLTYDQKFNAVEPGMLPELDLLNLSLEPEAVVTQFSPIAAYRAASGSTTLTLVDYASAGASGTAYRSWMPARNGEPSPFRLLRPTGNLPVRSDRPLLLTWMPSVPGSLYEVTLGEGPDRSQSLKTWTDVDQPYVILDSGLEAGKTYYWQVAAKTEGREVAALNGPKAFDVVAPDASVGTGEVLIHASLHGTADPATGVLREAAAVVPAMGYRGEEGTGLAFDGKTSKVVYRVDDFPVLDYTLSILVKPQGPQQKGQQWYQICSAWKKGMDDPLRISLVDGRVVAQMEMAKGGARIDGPAIPDHAWTRVTLVKDRSELRLYINGQFFGQTVVPELLDTEADSLGIGCNPNFGQLEGLSAVFSNLVFESVARSDAEILTAYTQTAK